MEKAIGEIAPRVTQCSISVASQTAKDLVLKVIMLVYPFPPCIQVVLYF